MKPLFPLFAGRLLAVASALLLTACGAKEAPRYKLTDAERSWADAYNKGDLLRFRNPATGYERRYKVNEVTDKMQPHIPKSLSVSYYQQQVTVTVLREDSTSFQSTGPFAPAGISRHQMTLSLLARVRNSDADDMKLFMTWTDQLSLPIGVMELGQAPSVPYRMLPTFTTGGRIYQNVLVYEAPVTTNTMMAWQLRRMHYTKAEGIIRFEEFGGRVWERQ